MKRNHSVLFKLTAALLLFISIAVPVNAIDNPEKAKEVIYDAMHQQIVEIDLEEFNIREEEAEAFFLEVSSSNERPWYVAPHSVNYTVSGDGIVTSYYPLYLSDKMFDWALYEDKMDQIIAQTVFDGMSDWQIALSIHDYLASHFTYDVTLEKGIGYDLLVDGTAVCAGYAQAYSDLLSLAGVRCYYVTSQEMNHAWCLVEIDGKLYHADPTWGDPLFDEGGTNIHGYTSHSYFLKSDAYYAIEDHFLSSHYGWSPEYTAVDTGFDQGMFWEYLNSPVVYLDSDHCIFKRYEDGFDRIYLRSESENTETILCESENEFYHFGSDGYSIYPANGLSVWEDLIYYCDMYHIYSVPVTGGEPTVVYSFDVATEQKVLRAVMVYQDRMFFSVMDHDGNYESRSILLPDHVHNYEITVTEPTCTEKGFTRHFCAGCHDEYFTNEFDPLNHAYTTEIVAPTCEAQGYTLHTCQNCSDFYRDSYIGATGHSWGPHQSDGNATCTIDGTKTSRCKNCSAFDTIPDPGSAKGHEWNEGIITKEPAEGVKGEKTFTCTCGETRVESIDPLPESCSHKSTMISHQTDPYCTTIGYTGDVICTDCNTILEKGYVIDALGHKNVTDNSVAATCETSGLTEGQHCSVCGLTIVAQVSIAPLGHSFGPWTETIPATTTSMGEERCRCETCGAEQVRNTDPLINPFSDVAPGAYYETSVLWAVKQGVTNGISLTSFGPDQKCTRNQVVTFLWRAAGEPEPTSNENPFVDVAQSDYFYQAVLWAVEKGITNGVDATHFGSAQECTRAQVATFLWRAMGKPDPKSASNSFKDISAGEYYYDAVLWAVEKGITNGMSPTTFAPDDTCTRGQIVTFLYRTLQ